MLERRPPSLEDTKANPSRSETMAMGSKGASWVFFHTVVAWRARSQTLLPLSANATYPDSSP